MTRGSVEEEERVSPVGRPTGYNPALDGVRAIAVVMVILSHTFVPYTGGGKTGVLVFFVLSGFLITRLLLKERETAGRVSVGNFYMRRALRLFPALLAATAAYAAAALHYADEQEAAADTLGALPSALFYYLNWQAIVDRGSTGWLTHYWSLSVEEQFYLLWPFLLLLAYRVAKVRGVFWLATIGAAASLAEKWILTVDPIRQLGTDFAADGLLLGCALAAATLLWPDAVTRIGRLLFWPAVAAVLAAFVLGDSTSHASELEALLFGKLWWPVVVVASTVIVAALDVRTAHQRACEVLSWRPLAYLGRISYGMYLWHALVLLAVNRVGPPVPIGVVVTLIGTVGVAAASYELMEKRFLRRKSRYEAPVTEAVSPRSS